MKRSAIYPGIIAIAGLVGFLTIFGSLFVSLLIVIFTLVDGLFIITDSVRRQALHDKWSGGTIVVKAPR
jgi:uncharacterized RDD family membrane protein YckC